MVYYIILLLAFGGLAYLYVDMSYRHTKLLNKLKESQDKLTKTESELVEANIKVAKWNAEYYEDLKNFKKLIKMYGKEIDYIPYYYVCNKSIDDGIVDIKEEYVIPQIRIVYHNGMLEEHYNNLTAKEKEEFEND